MSAADADASGQRVVDVAQEANQRSEAQADKIETWLAQPGPRENSCFRQFMTHPALRHT